MCQGLPADAGWEGVRGYPALNDPDGPGVPAGWEVIDAHVHLFPPRVFSAIWRWFDAHAWPVRHRLETPEVVAFLKARGVKRIVGLCYAHVPGMARALNAAMAEAQAADPGFVTGFGTVLPGEPDAEAVVAEALALGLQGLKLHCHVQRFAPDDPALDGVYARLAEAGKPVVIHAGREPALPGYRADLRALCAAERVARVLAKHPGLTLVVPHLGADEIPAYARLLERHPGLYLDTTMMLADYFPQRVEPAWLTTHAERLIFGTDFPNLPYAWDRELSRLLALPLPDAAKRRILAGTARQALGLPAEAPVS